MSGLLLCHKEVLKDPFWNAEFSQMLCYPSDVMTLKLRIVGMNQSCLKYLNSSPRIQSETFCLHQRIAFNEKTDTMISGGTDSNASLG